MKCAMYPTCSVLSVCVLQYVAKESWLFFPCILDAVTLHVTLLKSFFSDLWKMQYYFTWRILKFHLCGVYQNEIVITRPLDQPRKAKCKPFKCTLENFNLGLQNYIIPPSLFFFPLEILTVISLLLVLVIICSLVCNALLLCGIQVLVYNCFC